MLNFEATLRPMVKDIAKQVSYKFPSSVMREDIEQDLWVWAYRNQKSISKKIVNDPEAWIEQVATTMRKQALSFGKDELDSAEGRVAQDLQKYSVNEIRALLPDVFDYEDWQSFASVSDGQPKSKGMANATGDRLVSLVDVKKQVLKLNNDQYNVIVWHYKYGLPFETIAEEYDCSLDAARKRVERAVKAVQRGLGTVPQKEYTGRRTVRSNAAWRAASDNYYQEN